MAGPDTAPNGQIQAARKPGAELSDMLIQMQGEIARALPKHITPDRMARVVTTALRMNPDLGKSDTPSFLGSVLALAQLGLEPNTPLQQAWLIPRRATKRRDGGFETTVMIGYQGYLALAMRSGLVTSVYSIPVFRTDTFAYRYGTDPGIEHVPDESEERVAHEGITHVYAVARIRNGDPLFEVMTRQQVNERRARSANANGGPWATDTIAMMRKTAIRALWPYMPKSAEMVMADALDQAHDTGRSVQSALANIDGPARERLELMGASMDVEPSEDADEPEEAR